MAVNQRTNELTYSNKQIIAREVELQTMRRSAPKNGGATAAAAAPSKSNKVVQRPKPQNHLQKLSTKGVNTVTKTKDLVCMSFNLRSMLSFMFSMLLFCPFAFLHSITQTNEYILYLLMSFQINNNEL